ncbi:MAG TPA: sugar transferase [Candidatus Acidoferrales bacterium]|nr:sugar transferase [Candidatus Acidoferrales bacterium]
MKRLFDLSVAAFAIVLLFPLLAAIAFLIKSDSSGPVFYRAKRAGLQRRPFIMLKFRTMLANAEKMGGPSTPCDDPRITRIGKLLRKHKLDELPQLINVLRGEMSLVGPRPEVFSEVDTYSEEEQQLLSVLPGMTDWASLRFSNEGEILKGSADPHVAYRQKIRPEKIRLGLRYVRERSLLMDFRILAHTVKIILLKSSPERTAQN